MRPPCALCEGLRCGPPAPLERPAAASLQHGPSERRPGEPRALDLHVRPAAPSHHPEPRANPAPVSHTLQFRRGFFPLQPLRVLVPNFFLPRRGAPRLSAVTVRFIIPNDPNHPPAVRLRLCGAFPGQEPTCSAVGPVALTPVAPRVSHAVSGRSRCPCLPLSASSGCVAAIPPRKASPRRPSPRLG